MAGTERRPPWYQREPYPSIVRVLLDHELLTEGGTASLRLAGRVVEAEQRATHDPLHAVVVQLADEGLVGSPAPPHVWDAAQAIVDVLVEHRAPADPS